VELETCNKTYNIHNGDSNDDTSVYSSTIARSFTMSRGGFYQDKGGLPTADAAVFSHSTIAPQHIRSSLMVCHGLGFGVGAFDCRNRYPFELFTLLYVDKALLR